MADIDNDGDEFEIEYTKVCIIIMSFDLRWLSIENT